ncbi:hypothetical protein WJX75_006507 [Coccomyxa subellipsoidea]|uniref:HECT domain-containing protein n=1 Tax=Coccomyxa subellipsoidea TaxID=248742 RepID=A0ABR2YJJ7_9CHLO
MYKRPCARVIIDHKGSIVVRPSALELHLRPSSQSVKAHYLKSYQAALAGVLRLQFSPVKAFLGGRSGALTLADNPTVFAYLCATGLDMGALSDMGDGSLGDATETDTASVSSEEQQARMPAWAHALVDQLGGTSLENKFLRTVRMPRVADEDFVTGCT